MLFSVSIIPLRGPADQRATVGDAVELKFDVAGSPPIQYTWYRNGEILADDGRIANSTTGTLLLSSLKLEDYGNYSCIATNPVNMLTSENAKLSGKLRALVIYRCSQLCSGYYNNIII